MRRLNRETFAENTDVSLLDPSATRADFERMVREVKRCGFKRVCVPSSAVGLMKRLLAGAGVQICAAVGFPFGYASSRAKAEEAAQAVLDGASEVDVVVNIGALLSGDNVAFREDLRTVVRSVGDVGEAIIKAILGVNYLTEDQVRFGFRLVQEGGVRFIATATGFGPDGVNADHVGCLVDMVRGTPVSIKASGGIYSLGDAQAAWAAGANRLGTECKHALAIYGGFSPAAS